VAEMKSIEVTEEMIRAGTQSYLSWDHREDDPREIVSEIFQVMRDAERIVPGLVVRPTKLLP